MESRVNLREQSLKAKCYCVTDSEPVPREGERTQRGERIERKQACERWEDDSTSDRVPVEENDREL